MQAMVLDAPGQKVQMCSVHRPQPEPGQLLIEIAACAVCRTDLHVVDGELPHPKLPIIPGHEIVGRVIARGADVRNFAIGERIGIPRLGWTCGHCRYCFRIPDSYSDMEAAAAVRRGDRIPRTQNDGQCRTDRNFRSARRIRL